MRSPDAVTLRRAPKRAVLRNELWGVVSGRALWVMLLILCPIVGYSFFQGVSLYGEASAAATDSPVLASGLSPLDGVLVPTFGAFYITVTLLFPFVAIRALGREKESGTLRLLVQLPYRMPTLVCAKLTAVAGAWLVSAMPALSALALWAFLGGHLYGPETLNLLFGHLLYGLLVAAIALFAASIADSSATAAIITLAFTIGSWVLDFSLAGQPGLLEWVSQLSLTQTLRPFEQGLFPVGLVIGSLSAIAGFTALAAAWLHPGVPVRTKLTRSSLCAGVLGLLLIVADAGEDFDRSHRRPAQLISCSRPARSAATSRAARHHRSSCAGGPALRRSAPQCSIQARSDACERRHSAGDIAPERRWRHERRVLRRDRIRSMAAAWTRAVRQVIERSCRFVRTGGDTGAPAHRR